MFKIGDIIRHIDKPVVLHKITNISEMGIIAGNLTLNWDDIFYYELVNPEPALCARNALKELRDLIDLDSQRLRDKDAAIAKLFKQKQAYWEDLKQARLRVISAESSEFVTFCMLLGMSVAFGFMLGLWILQ